MPECILDRERVKRGNRAVTMVLVQWQWCDPQAATWELLFDLQIKYPLNTLEDMGVIERRILIQETKGRQVAAHEVCTSWVSKIITVEYYGGMGTIAKQRGIINSNGQSKVS